MKVQFIGLQSHNLVNRRKKSNTKISTPLMTDNDKNLYNPSFSSGGYGIALRNARCGRLRILERTHEEMIDMAESLHEYSPNIILSIATVYKWLGFATDKPKTEIAYKKLSEAIQEVIEKKSKILAQIENNTGDLSALKNELDRIAEKVKKSYHEYDLFIENSGV
ncbi:MAG TPA: hypothetical protein PLG15_05710 [Candidatus Gastranaerophilaceae bacterium]|nr:hypothetical protein [Candidatus Gastranaerophilaceae bacterium]HPT41861.1 hypothetical protein [Candidatus Gastranaerophilaceae bacterium]